VIFEPKEPSRNRIPRQFWEFGMVPLGLIVAAILVSLVHLLFKLIS